MNDVGLKSDRSLSSDSLPPPVTLPAGIIAHLRSSRRRISAIRATSAQVAPSMRAHACVHTLHPSMRASPFFKRPIVSLFSSVLIELFFACVAAVETVLLGGICAGVAFILGRVVEGYATNGAASFASML